jgi:hypothetical protein
LVLEEILGDVRVAGAHPCREDNQLGCGLLGRGCGASQRSR